jgi:putative ABC transport system permease protein
MKGVSIASTTNTTQTMLFGTTTKYPFVRGMTVTEGGLWSELEETAKARVIVLGPTLATKLFANRDPIGETVRIGRHPYRVIGVTSRRGVTPKGTDLDDTALLPIGTMRAHILPLIGGNVSSLNLVATSPEAMFRVTDEVTALLRERHGLKPGDPADFLVLNFVQMARGQVRSHELLTMLLAAVAAISLVVGGVGVSNVMLVSVAERKREIGICLAIGAGPGQIALQFLTEAIVLSIVGGLVGIAIGVGGASFIAAEFGWSSYLDASVLLVGLGASALTGLAFGFVPALRAAQLDPITAMRRE